MKSNERLDSFKNFVQTFYESLTLAPDFDITDSIIFTAKFFFLLYVNSIGEVFRKDSLKEIFMNSKDPEKLRSDIQYLFFIHSTEFPTSFINGPFFDYSDKVPELSVFTMALLKDPETYKLDWKDFSPQDFCYIFDSAILKNLNDRKGIYFTSTKNIHKVIDPLFLDELYETFEKGKTEVKNKFNYLLQFKRKIADLKFLDPASGAGNFLAEAYISLRKLAKEINEYVAYEQLFFKGLEFLRINIDNFYGIEIDPALAFISKITLLIADMHVNLKEEKQVFPLPYVNNIYNNNALTIDWNSIISKEDLNYIMGNPPFIGARNMSLAQKIELNNIFGDEWENSGNLDYVSCWFKKTFDYIEGTDIEAAFVATSSIVEGVSADALFRQLIQNGMIIDFAYTSFKWTEDNYNFANVFVVIIGFRANRKIKDHYIYSNCERKKAKHINGYLIDGPEYYIRGLSAPISDIKDIRIGNKPIDGGYYIFSEDEYKDFLNKEPLSEKYFKPFIGTYEYLSDKNRYCLDIEDITDEDLNAAPLIRERLELVKNYRDNSSSPVTKVLSNTPNRFHVVNKPKQDYIIIPRVISPELIYLPAGLLDKNSLVSDSMLVIDDNSLVTLAVLLSDIHFKWLKFVGGKYGQSYRYSKDIVYNNFPWPSFTNEEKAKLESNVREILRLRKKYNDIPLRKLYKDRFMPDDLKEAHKKNDELVLKAYKFSDESEDKLMNNLIDLHRKALENSKNTIIQLKYFY